MKAGEKDRLKVLRLILAAIKQVEVDDACERRRCRRARVCSTRWSSSARTRSSNFTKGDREDLVAIERGRDRRSSTPTCPRRSDDAELDALIDEVIAATGAESIRDMGKVMGQIKVQGRRRADMGAVGARVKARLTTAA